MNRVSITILLFASIAICVAIWFIFDRFFVKQQNQLLERLDPASAIEAATSGMGHGIRIQSAIGNAWLSIAGNQGGSLNHQQRQQLFELPDLVELIAVSMMAGDGLFTALSKVASRSNGTVAEDLKRVVLSVELGATLPQQLQAWAKRAESRHISELCTKLQLALVRGTPLAELLTEQATSLRAEAQQVLSKKAGQNETRMLIPLIFLILPITVMFAIYPSLQVLSLTQ